MKSVPGRGRWTLLALLLSLVLCMSFHSVLAELDVPDDNHHHDPESYAQKESTVSSEAVSQGEQEKAREGNTELTTKDDAPKSADDLSSGASDTLVQEESDAMAWPPAEDNIIPMHEAEPAGDAYGDGHVAAAAVIDELLPPTSSESSTVEAPSVSKTPAHSGDSVRESSTTAQPDNDGGTTTDHMNADDGNDIDASSVEASFVERLEPSVDVPADEGEGASFTTPQPSRESTADAAKGVGEEFDVIAEPSPGLHNLSRYYYSAIKALYVEGNISSVVQRLRDGVAAGHPRLHWLLGVLYANGVGVPRSDAKAILHYTVAAMGNVPEAHLALGYRHAHGIGVLKRCEIAVSHYREAADAVAMTYDGTPTPIQSRAERFAAGSSEYASGAHERDDRKRSTWTLSERVYWADNGITSAMVSLGYSYMRGRDGVARDWHRARHYFFLAQEKRDPRGCGGLGQLYVVGDLTSQPPVPPDLAQAELYFRRGAELEDAVSLNGLGYLHAINYLQDDKRNISVAPAADFRTAAKYFSRSSELGCAEGSYNLGVLLFHGRGVPVDRPAAVKFFQRAAAEGSVLAMWQLAHLTQRCDTALPLFQRVASYGSWYDRNSPTRYTFSADWLDTESPDPHVADETPKKVTISHREGRGWQAHQRLAARREEMENTGRGRDSRVSPRTSPSVPSTFAEYSVEVGDSASSLASFFENLVLAETGHTQARWKAILALDETIHVLGESDGDELRREDLEDAKDPAFANGGRLPDDTDEYVDGATVLLYWSAMKDAEGRTSAPAAGREGRRGSLRLLSQREAKHMLRYQLLMRCAQDGDAEANASLGDFFYYGESLLLGTNLRAAMTYYKAAADRMHPKALFNVGMFYQFGLGASATAEPSRHPTESLQDTSFAGGPRASTYSQVDAQRPARQQLMAAVLRVIHNEPEAWQRDLHMAKRYYDLAASQHAGAFYAVRLALVSLNFQMWWLHFSQKRYGLSEMFRLGMPYFKENNTHPPWADTTLKKTGDIPQGQRLFEVPGAKGRRKVDMVNFSSVDARAMVREDYLTIESLLLLVFGILVVAITMLNWYVT